MHGILRRRLYLLYVLVAASIVFVFAHWNALINTYAINDDVRQQIYWMQGWSDPELYQDDLLTRYARSYVPWGVRALYAVASHWIEPIEFSKILTGFLFVVTTGFLFGLGLQFKDDLTAVLVSCVSFLFGNFLLRMSGALSRGFVYPLMAAYLFFLARNRVLAAGLILLLQSVFNPYGFLVCFTTHCLFLIHRYGKDIVDARIRRAYRRPGEAAGGGAASFSYSGEALDNLPSPLKLIASSLPVAAAVAIMVLTHGVLKPTEFGELATPAHILGKIEYTGLGRYAIVPVPSFFFEIIHPWAPGYDPAGWNTVVGIALFFIILAAAGWTFTRNKGVVDVAGFRVFAYLLAASTLLYFVSYAFLLKLFLPKRYLEYSLNLFYCVLVGVGLRVGIEEFGLRRYAFPIIVTLLVLFGAVRLHGVGLQDFSQHAKLYRFLETTPKNSMLAGHPEIMDNVVTFAKRKAFVTFELSHTWYDRYWDIVKKRTFDFFDAYYASDPEDIRRFCRENSIDYVVVRQQDFPPIHSGRKPIYFEPFNTYIRDLLSSRSHFAILDTTQFPPLFDEKGVRVVKPN